MKCSPMTMVPFWADEQNEFDFQENWSRCDFVTAWPKQFPWMYVDFVPSDLSSIAVCPSGEHGESESMTERKNLKRKIARKKRKNSVKLRMKALEIAETKAKARESSRKKRAEMEIETRESSRKKRAETKIKVSKPSRWKRVETKVEARERALRLRKCLDKARTVLVWRLHWQGASAHEIAKALKLTHQAVCRDLRKSLWSVELDAPRWNKRQRKAKAIEEGN